MLRIHTSNSAKKAKEYFSSELTKGDYFFGAQEIAGQWGGKAAELLGLSGEVTKEAFNQLVDNINPQTGERLTPHNKGNRRPGYDMTFSAPKSLSVLYEYSKDERLLEAFREAVHDTMQSIEDGMHVRVRKDGLDEDRQTGNLVYGSFEHYTARPVEELAPDPQLHMHCFVMNASYDDVEQQWKAGQFGEIKRDAPYYEALFHSHLSDSLSKLGLDIERDGRFWNIEGLDRETLDNFLIERYR
ncbi:MAG: relaxase domain-containing protein [Candidatus Thiodiazotropha sp. (ex Semelilucina semeliformis)]|nr:relaxase domain-containing protein [Candidatus Thiodiazotropha sp. (ex Semelilucina semeliformis)]